MYLKKRISQISHWNVFVLNFHVVSCTKTLDFVDFAPPIFGGYEICEICEIGFWLLGEADWKAKSSEIAEKSQKMN